ncbi:hypothetical protein COV83_04945 [Candidatus Peregrinibacteria bacterium CG11_big_fil_rev_8_21_14_0_20_49_14]|nr:MAG: hypothetical protein COV83_04945 [Candidatus Peregrinibacteria bacterium CG11_big_fil_rev_8_21_14_0_20_49_14]
MPEYVKRNTLAIVTCALLIFLSVTARMWFAQSELWYDEILSVILSERIVHPLGVFTQIHHDNSHYFNTIFLRFLGYDSSYIAYHSLSLLFGALLQIVASIYAFRRSTTEGVIFTVMTTCSFFLFLYGWQARGYAPMLFFGLLSYYFLSEYLAHPRLLLAIGYGLSACIALLWHLTFLHFLLGFFLWSAFVLRRNCERKDMVIHLLHCFLLPILLLLVLYVTDIRVMEIGGGEKKSLDLILQSILTASIGFPREGTAASMLLSFIVLCAIIAAVERRMHASQDDALLFILMLFVVPIISLICLQPSFVYPRYFLPNLFFLIVLYARTATDMYGKGGHYKVASVAFVALYCVGNVATIASYAPLVSGGHVPTLSYIAEHSNDSAIFVGSTSDVHNSSILYFYSKRLAQDFRYVSREEAVANPPRWYLQDKSAFAIVQTPQLAANGVMYCLDSSLPQKGHRWALYARCDAKSQAS